MLPPGHCQQRGPAWRMDEHRTGLLFCAHGRTRRPGQPPRDDAGPVGQPERPRRRRHRLRGVPGPARGRRPERSAGDRPPTFMDAFDMQWAGPDRLVLAAQNRVTGRGLSSSTSAPAGPATAVGSRGRRSRQPGRDACLPDHGHERLGRGGPAHVRAARPAPAVGGPSGAPSRRGGGSAPSGGCPSGAAGDPTDSGGPRGESAVPGKRRPCLPTGLQSRPREPAGSYGRRALAAAAWHARTAVARNAVVSTVALLSAGPRAAKVKGVAITITRPTWYA